MPKNLYKQKFRESWLNKPDFVEWIERDANDSNKAYCKLCKSTITAKKMRNGDGPAPFNFGDNGCASEWKKRLRGFDIYAKAMNITKATEKLNWMLHYAGPKIQEVFSSLPEDEEEHKTQGPFASGYVFKSNAYTKAVNRLNKFFEPKQNQPFERHVFRQMRQKEPFNMFLVRLREQGGRCNFHEQMDENICDQIISGCYSDTLRHKVLERGDGDMNKIIRMAQSLESALKGQEYFRKHEVSTADGLQQVLVEEENANSRYATLCRSAKDLILDGNGRKLIEMCESFKLTVLNGRTASDSTGDLTFLRGQASSTIDYCLIEGKWLDAVVDMETTLLIICPEE
ncbi:hypothetical protein ACLKA6_000681 [Drosophila palustris]